MLTLRTNYLRAARRQAQLSLTTAATALGINKGTLSRYENGIHKVKAETLLKMANLYNVPLSDLVKEERQ